MNKKIGCYKLAFLFVFILSFLLLYNLPSAEAKRGCCSHHGGVCGCRCCDGTPLSAICAPYYPSCSDSQPSYPKKNYTQEKDEIVSQDSKENEENTTTDKKEVVYVGSINSNKYHYTWCRWAQKISPYNLVGFSSAKEAKSKGYIPCKVCRPPSEDKKQ